MQCLVNDVAAHFVEHGEGAPVLVLHGAGVDHREAEACFEPALAAHGGLRRIYPDLPGMGLTPAPAEVQSADDVLEWLFGFADEVTGGSPALLVGHSAGAYYCHGFASWRPDRVAGLALVCPLLPGVRDVPEHRPVRDGSGNRPVLAAQDIGDEAFRSYFVVHSPAMAERYERFVAPAARLVDDDAMARIGDRWELTLPDVPEYEGPALVVAGRQDSTVGYAAATDLADRLPHATVAVTDRAGHALPHEQPEVLVALVGEWLTRSTSGA